MCPWQRGPYCSCFHAHVQKRRPITNQKDIVLFCLLAPGGISCGTPLLSWELHVGRRDSEIVSNPLAAPEEET